MKMTPVQYVCLIAFSWELYSALLSAFIWLVCKNEAWPVVLGVPMLVASMYAIHERRCTITFAVFCAVTFHTAVLSVLIRLPELATAALLGLVIIVLYRICIRNTDRVGLFTQKMAMRSFLETAAENAKAMQKEDDNRFETRVDAE